MKKNQPTSKSCIWRLYIPLCFAEICQSVHEDYIELGCHKGTTAKRVTEKVVFAFLVKHYWLYDLFACKEGDEHTHLPGHANPNMHMDVVNRFANQPHVITTIGSVTEFFEQGFPATIAFADTDMNHPDPERAALTKVLPR